MKLQQPDPRGAREVAIACVVIMFVCVVLIVVGLIGRSHQRRPSPAPARTAPHPSTTPPHSQGNAAG